MEKSKLKLSDHSILPGEKIIEVMYEGKLVATVSGVDGPGVRVITKHPYDVVRGGRPGWNERPNIVEIRIEV